MVKTRSIFFWMGGVIAPNLQTLLSRALSECGKSEVNLPALPDYARLCEELALGKLDSRAFCAAICERTLLSPAPSELEEKLLSHLNPLPQVLQVIDLLPEAYERWLVVDYPASWLEMAGERLGLGRFFHPEKLIYLGESGLSRILPDIHYFLAHRAQIPLAEGLQIDANGKRAISALRHSMQAAVFIDARRLEREFVMRYFIERPQPVHKPSVTL